MLRIQRILLCRKEPICEFRKERHEPSFICKAKWSSARPRRGFYLGRPSPPRYFQEVKMNYACLFRMKPSP